VEKLAVSYKVWIVNTECWDQDSRRNVWEHEIRGDGPDRTLGGFCGGINCSDSGAEEYVFFTDFDRLG
jgi:hypothetical protein